MCSPASGIRGSDVLPQRCVRRGIPLRAEYAPVNVITSHPSICLFAPRPKSTRAVSASSIGSLFDHRITCDRTWRTARCGPGSRPAVRNRCRGRCPLLAFGNPPGSPPSPDNGRPGHRIWPQAAGTDAGAVERLRRDRARGGLGVAVVRADPPGPSEPCPSRAPAARRHEVPCPRRYRPPGGHRPGRHKVPCPRRYRPPDGHRPGRGAAVPRRVTVAPGCVTLMRGCVGAWVRGCVAVVRARGGGPRRAVTVYRPRPAARGHGPRPRRRTGVGAAAVVPDGPVAHGVARLGGLAGGVRNIRDVRERPYRVPVTRQPRSARPVRSPPVWARGRRPRGSGRPRLWPPVRRRMVSCGSAASWAGARGAQTAASRPDGPPGAPWVRDGGIPGGPPAAVGARCARTAASGAGGPPRGWRAR
jgi:hypothetical protein